MTKPMLVVLVLAVALLALCLVGALWWLWRLNKLQLSDTEKALAEAQKKFKDFSAYRTRLAALTADMQQADSYEALARTVLLRSTEMIGAQYGTLYVLDEDSQRLLQVGSFCAQKHDEETRSFAMGEGLVGQCAQDQHGVQILKLPDTPLRIVSGIGSAVPRQVLLQALVQKEKVVGVLEFAAINAFGDKAQYLLEELMPSLAMSIEILDRNLRTRALLQAKREQADQLEMQTAALKDSFAKRDAANQALQAQVAELADARRAMLNIMEDLEMARATENIAASASATVAAAKNEAQSK